MMKDINIDLLNGYLETLDINILQEMVTLYINESKIYLGDIVFAVENSDHTAWQLCCHKMKGAAASAGLLQVREKLAEIEHLAVSDTVKLEYITCLQKLNDQGIAQLKQWLNNQ